MSITFSKNCARRELLKVVVNLRDYQVAHLFADSIRCCYLYNAKHLKMHTFLKLNEIMLFDYKIFDYMTFYGFYNTN